MFVHRTKIRFAHVDAAGIVFYPRYFEMLNAAVEDWFAEDFGRDFRSLHLEERIGTPTVQLECEFVSPAMLGDEIAVHLTPVKIGNSSCRFAFCFETGNHVRLKGSAVLVGMDLDRQQSRSWAAAIRAAMELHRDNGVA
ncbi:MAG: acyl-CoA thioesterase [Sphingomonadaceae bacterium]|nr:acyl-CoA thioesterase [Sphingomonadaceae bacterium]